MYLIIPLGGSGSRFKQSGYTHPKPLIHVFGKPILFWLLDNLNLTNIHTILIPYNDEMHKYNFEQWMQHEYPCLRFRFLRLHSQTRGAAESILEMLNALAKEQEENEEKEKKAKDDCPILSLDGDNFFTCDIVSLWAGNNKVFTFEDFTTDPIYSYVQTEPGDPTRIVDIAEKLKISNYACTGAYGFGSWIDLRRACNHVIDNKMLQKGEFYTSSLVQVMLQTQQPFLNELVSKNDFVCLGTPIHLKIFYNNYPIVDAFYQKKTFHQRTVCFDLDNTLVSYPLIHGDYTTCQPIDRNVQFLRYLKRIGCKIIIHTARRMKTYGSNLGALIKDIGLITLQSLDRFSIPYDEIYFGKPNADFYIDDKAVNSSACDLEKETGFYNMSIQERDFNSLKQCQSIEVLKKCSSDLKGEIMYNLQLPASLKDMFPHFFDYDRETFKWYEMEKIKGVTITHLYLNEELTATLLMSVLQSLQRIHSTESAYPDCNPSLIYNNYRNKVQARYESYDYSVFPKSDACYQKLIAFLEAYEGANRGRMTRIHGDPVFTNVMVNNLGKIKMFDCRGKLGDVVTDQGDVFYDYAKVYQSLMGYDEILMDKSVSYAYKQRLLEAFREFMLSSYGPESWSDLQFLTASLFFSLIPLHNNDKCIRYFHMAASLI